MTGSEDAVPDGDEAFDCRTSKDPRSVVPSPHREEDVTWAYSNAPDETTPLNPYRLMGDVQVYV